MKSVYALSITPTVNDWLANTRQPHILHVFNQALNLLNERKQVLSIVTPQIGMGPFNLVVKGRSVSFKDVRIESPVIILGRQLTIEDVAINTTDAKCWSPRPDWEKLHANRMSIARQLAPFPIPNTQVPDILQSSLALPLARGDRSSSKRIAARLAGLGMGLTPAGDDFILGAIYAARIIHPPELAEILAMEIANITAPLTTSLSAAWLQSAGNGEAGIQWHRLFSALSQSNPWQIRSSMDTILAVGATSGADALAGFISTFTSYTSYTEAK